MAATAEPIASAADASLWLHHAVVPPNNTTIFDLDQKAVTNGSLDKAISSTGTAIHKPSTGHASAYHMDKHTPKPGD